MNDLWETLRGNLEARVPFKKASLNNKARNLVLVDRLHVEFVQTTDARLRRGLPGEQSSLPFGFRRPYAWVILVTCDVSLPFFKIPPHFVIDCISVTNRWSNFLVLSTKFPHLQLLRISRNMTNYFSYTYRSILFAPLLLHASPKTGLKKWVLVLSV